MNTATVFALISPLSDDSPPPLPFNRSGAQLDQLNYSDLK